MKVMIFANNLMVWGEIVANVQDQLINEWVRMVTLYGMKINSEMSKYIVMTRTEREDTLVWGEEKYEG